MQPGCRQRSAGGSPRTAWRGGWVGQSGGGTEFGLDPCYAAGMETKPPISLAILVGIKTPEVDDVAHAASLEELGRLVKTLG